MSSIYAVSYKYVDLEKHMSACVRKSFREFPHAIQEGFAVWLGLDVLMRGFVKEFLERIESEADDVDQENPCRQTHSCEQHNVADDEIRSEVGDTASVKTVGRNVAQAEMEQGWCLYLHKLVSDEDKARDDYHVRNVWGLPLKERWKLYRYWASLAIEAMKEAASSVRAHMGVIKDSIVQKQLQNDLDLLAKPLLLESPPQEQRKIVL